MEKILVSACLLGDRCRYDGKDNFFPFLEELRKHYELVAFCPEMAANLGCPREKAEIQNGRVITESKKDVTDAYNKSAEQAVRLCDFLGIHIAILKDKSPACGSRHIHNGMFMGNTIEGVGVTAAALIRANVKVYAETDALSFLLPNKEEEKEKNGKYKSYSKKNVKSGDKKPTFEKKAYDKKEKDGSYKKTAKPKDGFKKDKPYKKKTDGKTYDKSEKRESLYNKDNKKKSFSNYKKPYAKGKPSTENKEQSFSKKKGNAYHKDRSFSRNKKMRDSSSYKHSYKKDFKKNKDE